MCVNGLKECLTHSQHSVIVRVLFCFNFPFVTFPEHIFPSGTSSRGRVQHPDKSHDFGSLEPRPSNRIQILRTLPTPFPTQTPLVLQTLLPSTSSGRFPKPLRPLGFLLPLNVHRIFGNLHGSISSVERAFLNPQGSRAPPAAAFCFLQDPKTKSTSASQQFASAPSFFPESFPSSLSSHFPLPGTYPETSSIISLLPTSKIPQPLIHTCWLSAYTLTDIQSHLLGTSARCSCLKPLLFVLEVI